MSTALGMLPLMTFVPVEGDTSREYVAAFRQNALQRLYKGEPAELMFPAHPGHRLPRGSGRCAAGDWRESVSGPGQTADHDALNTMAGRWWYWGDRSTFCRIRSAAGCYPRGGGLLRSPERAVADQEDPDPHEELENYIYLDHKLATGRREDQPSPRRGQAQRFQPVNNHLPHPLRTGFNTAAHAADGVRQGLPGVMTVAGVPSPSSWPALSISTWSA